MKNFMQRKLRKKVSDVLPATRKIGILYIWKRIKRCLRHRNRLRQVTVGRSNQKSASLIRPKETVERILNILPATRKIRNSIHMETNKKMFKAKGAIRVAGRSNRKSTSLIRQKKAGTTSKISPAIQKIGIFIHMETNKKMFKAKEQTKAGNGWAFQSEVCKSNKAKRNSRTNYEHFTSYTKNQEFYTYGNDQKDV